MLCKNQGPKVINPLQMISIETTKSTEFHGTHTKMKPETLSKKKTLCFSRCPLLKFNIFLKAKAFRGEKLHPKPILILAPPSPTIALEGNLRSGILKLGNAKLGILTSGSTFNDHVFFRFRAGYTP